jgi:hypothetical protein
VRGELSTSRPKHLNDLYDLILLPRDPSVHESQACHQHWHARWHPSFELSSFALSAKRCVATTDACRYPAVRQARTARQRRRCSAAGRGLRRSPGSPRSSADTRPPSRPGSAGAPGGGVRGGNPAGLRGEPHPRSGAAPHYTVRAARLLCRVRRQRESYTGVLKSARTQPHTPAWGPDVTLM